MTQHTKQSMTIYSHHTQQRFRRKIPRTLILYGKWSTFVIVLVLSFYVIDHYKSPFCQYVLKYTGISGWSFFVLLYCSSVTFVFCLLLEADHKSVSFMVLNNCCSIPRRWFKWGFAFIAIESSLISYRIIQQPQWIASSGRIPVEAFNIVMAFFLACCFFSISEILFANGRINSNETCAGKLFNILSVTVFAWTFSHGYYPLFPKQAHFIAFINPATL
ncbi:hypothetical protein IQ273_14715 [Nodosilinea sp. LEGE 07298]|uniref:hypothetical protein n=1 Tax=Nodosilinea sp. LEGE 07298 TaxID=2777970 RepID=UPI0018823051|nr:hypothetical protein [Nodosilinea sp. LEGE 07298]MBE9110671.1 hypothetical protein [Nodosilinea sp. LEGE 07298]